MKSVKIYIAFAILAYAFFMLLALPAQQGYSMLATMLPAPEKVRVAELHGTVWSGEAAGVLVNGYAIEKIRWSFRPLALLLGRLESSLAGRIGESHWQGVVSKGLGGFALKDVEFNLQGKLLKETPAAYGVALGGMVVGTFKKIIIHNGSFVEADGAAVWKQAAVARPLELKLGDFEAQIETVREGITVRISDSGGPLQVAGILMLAPAGHYSFSASFSSNDASQPELGEGLRFLGNPDTDGKVSISMVGNISDFVSLNLTGKRGNRQ